MFLKDIFCVSILLCLAASLTAQDNRGLIGDSRLPRITGAAPVNATDVFNQISASSPVRDITISPDNTMAYGMSFDGLVTAYKINNSGSAPTLTQVGSFFVSAISRPVSLKVSKDARTLWIGGEDQVVSVNLFDEPGAGRFTRMESYTLEGVGNHRIIDIELHPDGDVLFALAQGPRSESQKPDFPNDFGLIGRLDISQDVQLEDPPERNFISIPIVASVYDLFDMALSPDGNIGLITAHGSQTSIATPFGAFPRLDEATGGILVYDLNTFALLDRLSTTLRGQEDTLGIRRQIFSVGQQITHPKVRQQQIITDAADTASDIAFGLPGVGTLAGGIFIAEALIMNQVLQIYKEIYNFFGPMTAYANMFPSDMVGATGIAFSPRGDVGAVTYLDTNNVGFLSLGTSPDLGGYGPGSFPNFFFSAALEKTVSGLNLDLGIEGGDINFFPPYSWLGMRKISFTSDGSHAYVGMDGGTPSIDPALNRVGFIDMGRVREGIGELNGQQNREALSAGFLALYGSNGEPGVFPEFALPKSVATFHPFDTDGDTLSDHLEAFNRFNDLRSILFGDRTQVVSTNSQIIADPVRSRAEDVFPVNYADKGYFLPHSGPGYRFNYNGHLKFTVNVGSAPAVTTIEKVGRIWHQKLVDGDVSRAYFIVLNMSHPGEGLVQNEQGEFLHFNPRNGFQANFQYLKTGSDEPLDFVLSNGPTDPLNNSIEGPVGELDIPAMTELCTLLLDEPTVDRLIVDPKLVELISILQDNDRVEIRGSLDVENTRRDQDAFMKVLFRPAEGVGVDANDEVTFIDTNTDEPVNLIILEQDPNVEDAEAVGVKLDILRDGAAFLNINSSHELFFDADLTQRIDLSGNISITELLGTLWFKVDGPSSINMTVQVLDANGLNVGNNFVYNAEAILFDFDVGTGQVTPNEPDADGDDVPDYADGFNFDRFTGGGDVDNDSIPDDSDDQASNTFFPVTVEIQGPLDFSRDPTIRIDYDASLPTSITKFVSDFHPGLGKRLFGQIPRFALPTEGTLRFWKKDGSSKRTLLDFIAPGAHSLADLGMTESGTLTLYIEAVAPVIFGDITISLDPDGFNGPASFIADDTETVYTPGDRFDLKIDSNNDGSISLADDAIEDVGNRREFPGHLMLIHNSGSNGDGEADYLDQSGSAKHKFARLEFELPANFDPSTAIVSISYSASDPNRVIDTSIPGLDILPPGHLRIWKKDADQPRSASDYIPPGTFLLSDLPTSNTLYVEAVQPSSDIGDQRIIFQFRPGQVDLSGEPQYLGEFNSPVIDLNVKPTGIYQDSVRVTVYEQRWENSFALDAGHRKVDINGQPLLDPEPQSEPEVDLSKNGFYVDTFSRTPVYSTTDVSVPTLGQTLSMEMRRTASVDAYLSAGDTSVPVNPVGPDHILGPGWRTCLGMRVVHYQGIFTVYDENGQVHRYNAGGSPIPHSFEESTSIRSDLRINRSEDNPDIVLSVTWTNNFWKQFTFTLYSPNQAHFGKRPLVGQILRLGFISDTNGNTIECRYDSDSDSYPSSMREVGFTAKEMKFDYENKGANFGLRLRELTDPNGNKYKYMYDSSGRLEEVQFPNAQDSVGSSANGATREAYTYELQSSSFGDQTQAAFVAVKTITNPNGNRVEMDYELIDRDITFYEDDVDALRLTQIRTAAGSDIEGTATFEEISKDRYETFTRVIDFRGTQTDYEFITALIPSSVKDGLGFSFNGFIIPVLDMFKRTIFTANDGDMEWEYEFSNDTFSNLEKVVDSFGNERVFTYGRVNGFDHARYNRPFERIIDPEGLNLKSQFEYNFANRKLLKETKPRFFTEGGGGDLFVRTNDYDERRNIEMSSTRVTDADGVERTHASRFTYDAEGYISATMDPDGRVTRIERATLGNTWTDTVTLYKKFAAVELKSIDFGALEEFLKTTTTYDLNGNIIQEEVEYDNPEFPGSKKVDVTNYTYDAANNRIETELPNVKNGDTGNPPSMGRPLILCEYDGLGKKTKRTDARNTVTEFFYDERENKIEETTIIENNERITNLYEYDAASQITKHTDPNGNETDHTYDELNRRVETVEKNEYVVPGESPVSSSRMLSWQFKTNSGSGSFASDRWSHTEYSDYRNFTKESTFDNAYRLTSFRQVGTGGDSPATAADKFEEYELDANGNVTKITTHNPEGSGNQETFRDYDELDRMVREEIVVNGGENITKKRFYDNTNNVVAIVDGEGFVQQMEYNTLGLLAKRLTRVAPGGPNFTNDGFHEFVISTGGISDDDILATYEYDGRGNLMVETLRRYDENPPGGLIDIHKQYIYDGLNRLEKVIWNSDLSNVDRDDERIITYLYDFNDNLRLQIARREDYQGGFVEIETEHEYDLLDRKVFTRFPQVTDGEASDSFVRGVETIAYDANSNVVERINPRGTVTTMDYDGLDRVVRKVMNSDGASGVLTADDILTTFTYDNSDNVIRQVLRRMLNIDEPTLIDIVTLTEFDAFNRPTKTTDAEGNVYEIKFDSLDNQIMQIDPRGFQTDITYDTANRMIERLQPSILAFSPGSTGGSPGAVRPVNTYVYDRRSLLKEMVDGNGHLTQYFYDGAGRQIEVVNPEGNSMFYAYDQASNRTQTTDYRGQILTELYDRLNRRTAKIDDAGFVVSYQYDLLDNLMELTDANGEKERYVFDLLNRRISEQKRGNANTLEFVYNLENGLIRQTDENGLKTEYEYDAFNRVVKEIDNDGNEVVFAYDQANNRVLQSDEFQVETKYFYDGVDRLTELHEARGKVTTYAYDRSSNRTEIVDDNNFVTTFEYDALNRLTRHTLPTGGIYQYAYDLTENLIEMTTPNGESVFHVYDELDRLERKFFPNHNYTFEYDANSNRTRARHDVSNIGPTVQTWINRYEYDNRDLVEKVISEYPFVNPREMTYTYDGNRNFLTKITFNSRTLNYETNEQDLYSRINGDLGTGLLESVYQYDEALRPTLKLYNNDISSSYVYENRNLVLEMDTRNTVSDDEVYANEYLYNKKRYRLFEKESYTVPSTGDLAVNADVYRYDALYRVTGVHYGVPAERNETVNSSSALPQSPGVFADIDPVLGNYEEYAFDELHNKTIGVNQRGRHLYNHPADSSGTIVGYFADVVSRLFSMRSTVIDPGNPVNNTLFYIDFNGDAAFNAGEEVFVDNDGTPDGTYNPGTSELFAFFTGADQIIYDGGPPDANAVDDIESFAVLGRQDGLYFYDANGNLLYDTGEDLWAERNGSVDAQFNLGSDFLIALYTPGIDEPVYGGDVPENIADPLNNFNVPTGEAGATETLYYHDANANGRHDDGEDIWTSLTDATFNAGLDNIVGTGDDVDTVVYRGNDGLQMTSGELGSQSLLYYYDANSNEQWDAIESIWREIIPDAQGGLQNGVYYADLNLNQGWNETEDIWLNIVPDLVTDSGSGGSGSGDEPVAVLPFLLPLPGGPANTSGDLRTFDYDANGNKIRFGGTRTFTWTATNAMETVLENSTTTVRYIYDEEGRRCAEIFPSGARVNYYYDGLHVCIETDDSGAVTTEYLNGAELDKPIAMVRNGTTAFFTQNTLGNVQVLTDINGAVIERYDYDIYGNAKVLDADGNFQGDIDTALSPYLYTGRRYDPESEYYYMRSRYFSPEIGRFTSHAPYTYTNGMNLYAYANGNVVNMISSMGDYMNLVYSRVPMPTMDATNASQEMLASNAGGQGGKGKIGGNSRYSGGPSQWSRAGRAIGSMKNKLYQGAGNLLRDSKRTQGKRFAAKPATVSRARTHYSPSKSAGARVTNYLGHSGFKMPDTRKQSMKSVNETKALARRIADNTVTAASATAGILDTASGLYNIGVAFKGAGGNFTSLRGFNQGRRAASLNLQATNKIGYGGKGNIGLGEAAWIAGAGLALYDASSATDKYMDQMKRNFDSNVELHRIQHDYIMEQFRSGDITSEEATRRFREADANFAAQNEATYNAGVANIGLAAVRGIGNALDAVLPWSLKNTPLVGGFFQRLDHDGLDADQ